MTNPSRYSLMPPLKPGLSKRRSRRMRKKLHIAEFQRLAFDYSLVWAEIPDATQQEAFIERFLEEIIVKRNLRLGGGCTEGAIVGTVQNPTELDQEAVRSWCSIWPVVTKVNIGPLVDEWYEG